MDSSAITTIAMCAMMAIIVVATSMAEYKSKAKRKDGPPDPPPAFTSLSLLAGLSFFSGLGAILLAAIAGILTLSETMSDVIPMTDSTRRQVELGARIILYVSLLPAVAAAAFGLAARGVISESRGAVRGRPLYRTGLLLAVITAVIVFDAKILNPATWLAAKSEVTVEPGSGGANDIDRAYLGVELGLMDDNGTVPLTRVVPGSPADRAGLKAGDIVEKLDGRQIYSINPKSQGGYSPRMPVPYVGDYIGSLKPGTRVTVGIRRAGRPQEIVAELAPSFGSLLALVKRQSLDDERMAVLKAAGAERRYLADELRRICEAFDFDQYRLKVIETSLPQLQDPQNAYQVLGSLEFSGAKSRVSDWIEALNKPK
jgi:hypothetical protein